MRRSRWRRSPGDPRIPPDMPTYDYRCNACGHTFELFQTMSEREKRKCPECGKNKLERLIGMGAGLLFKGEGFYKTDYRSSDYKSRSRRPVGRRGASGKPRGGQGIHGPEPTAKAPAKQAEGKSPSQEVRQKVRQEGLKPRLRSGTTRARVRRSRGLRCPRSPAPPGA
ncbi:MAG: zinc ribbon domain-containing protein [Planctomycetota bacterium]